MALGRSALTVRPSPSTNQPTLNGPLRGAMALIRREDLEVALQQSQLDLGAAMKRITEYEAEIAELKMRLGRKKGQGQEGDKDAVKLVSDIVRLGKRHCVFYSLFIPGVAYHTPKPAFPHDSPARYSTEKSTGEGPAAELYSSIPENLHVMMASTDTFGTTFARGISEERSYAIDRVRKCANHIFNIPEQNIFKIDKENPNLRSSNPRIRFLLGLLESEEDDDVEEYEDYPPIFFQLEDTDKAKGLFLNQSLFMVALVIIYGENSVNCTSSNPPTLKNTSPFFPAEGHSLQATAGLISFCCAIALFVLSDDQKWPSSGIGSFSGINYHEVQERLKRLLIEGGDAKYIRRIYEGWQGGVFPKKIGSSNHSKAGQTEEDSRERRREEGIAGMRAKMQQEDQFSSAEEESWEDSARPFRSKTNGLEDRRAQEYDSDIYQRTEDEDRDGGARESEEEEGGRSNDGEEDEDEAEEQEVGQEQEAGSEEDEEDQEGGDVQGIPMAALTLEDRDQGGRSATGSVAALGRPHFGSLTSAQKRPSSAAPTALQPIPEGESELTFEEESLLFQHMSHYRVPAEQTPRRRKKFSDDGDESDEGGVDEDDGDKDENEDGTSPSPLKAKQPLRAGDWLKPKPLNFLQIKGSSAAALPNFTTSTPKAAPLLKHSTLKKAPAVTPVEKEATSNLLPPKPKPKPKQKSKTVIAAPPEIESEGDEESATKPKQTTAAKGAATAAAAIAPETDVDEAPITKPKPKPRKATKGAAVMTTAVPPAPETDADEAPAMKPKKKKASKGAAAATAIPPAPETDADEVPIIRPKQKMVAKAAAATTAVLAPETNAADEALVIKPKKKMATKGAAAAAAIPPAPETDADEAPTTQPKQKKAKKGAATAAAVTPETDADEAPVMNLKPKKTATKGAAKAAPIPPAPEIDAEEAPIMKPKKKTVAKGAATAAIPPAPEIDADEAPVMKPKKKTAAKGAAAASAIAPAPENETNEDAAPPTKPRQKKGAKEVAAEAPALPNENPVIAAEPLTPSFDPRRQQKRPTSEVLLSEYEAGQQHSEGLGGPLNPQAFGPVRRSSTRGQKPQV